jgi:hypothetical protein
MVNLKNRSAALAGILAVCVLSISAAKADDSHPTNENKSLRCELSGLPSGETLGQRLKTFSVPVTRLESGELLVSDTFVRASGGANGIEGEVGAYFAPTGADTVHISILHGKFTNDRLIKDQYSTLYANIPLKEGKFSLELISKRKGLTSAYLGCQL